MEETLNFNLDINDLISPISTGLADHHRQRSCCYALRILIGHPEICNSVMEDPERLLRLLGIDVAWPDKIILAIEDTLRAEGNDGATHVKQEEDSNGFISRLKSRNAWGGYESTIARLYCQQPELVLSALSDNLARLESTRDLDTPGNRNTSLLVKLLGLNAIESRLIDYSEARSYRLFSRFLGSVSGFAPTDAFRFVATAIQASPSHVRAALRSSASLRTYGLLQLDPTPCDLGDFLRLDTKGKNFLNEDFTSTEDMLRVFLLQGQDAHLLTEDFPHLEQELSLLTLFLRNSANEHASGANVLLYGPPGTGKSEFARLLAKEAGLTHFEVKSSDEDGDSIDGNERLNNFALSQRFLTERPDSLIIFDEIEDAFPENGIDFASLFGRGRQTSKTSQSKAWINHLLEGSTVPSIWITNSIESIDEAFLRRFAFHVEFRIPPKQVRERIVKRCVTDFPVSAGLITSLATDDHLSPAQITQAVRFANLCRPTSGDMNESTLIMAIKASQSAMGRRLHLESNPPLSGQCNFSYLNLDSDIAVDVIERALKRKPSATLCFHGVPGSGKTSLAHHLAETLGRPLLVRRASDLLGKYVGESERNIAKMFRDADNDVAVLLLDEADSFLRSRRHAERSWEVTQVNELLQQMENFQGVFICTTNLMDDVDDAALRRFTFKLRFNPLTQTQREALFAEVVYGTPTTTIEQPIFHALQKLETLTPGDFATIRRQEDLIGERYTPERFVQHLTRECALKPGCQSTTMGFLG